MKHRFFVKLYSRYGEYFPEYCNYFGIPLIMKKAIYGMTNSGKIFADELTNRLIDKVGFRQPNYQISIYYKYEKYGSKLVVLYYVNDCVYCYTSE